MNSIRILLATAMLAMCSARAATPLADARISGNSTISGNTTLSGNITSNATTTGGTLANVTVSGNTTLTGNVTSNATVTGGTLSAVTISGASVIDLSGATVTHRSALEAIESLAPSADKLPYYASSSTAALTDITSFARSLLDDANAAAARTTLGAAALGANADITSLTAITTLTSTANLTLAAASNGASIAFAQGANGGITITPKGAGYVELLGTGTLYLRSETIAPELVVFGHHATAFPIIAGYRSRGTRDNPTAVMQNDSFLQLGGAGYDGTKFPTANASEIWFDAADNQVPGSHPSLIRFFTTPQGSEATNHRQVMVLHANGRAAFGEGVNAEDPTARITVKHAAQADLTLKETVSGHTTTLLQQASASYIATSHDPLIFSIGGSDRGRITAGGLFAFGGAGATNVAFAAQGSPALTAANGFVAGTTIGHTLTASLNADVYGALLGATPAGAAVTFATHTSGTHANFFGTGVFRPSISNLGATVTTAATLWVQDAPSGTATSKYALLVAAGATRINGTFATASGVTWDFGGYTAGAPTPDGYLTVTVAGTTYRISADAQ